MNDNISNDNVEINGKGKKLILFITIICLLLIGLGGYYIYNNIISNKDSNEKENKQNDTNNRIELNSSEQENLLKLGTVLTQWGAVDTLGDVPFSDDWSKLMLLMQIDSLTTNCLMDPVEYEQYGGYLIDEDIQCFKSEIGKEIGGNGVSLLYLLDEIKTYAKNIFNKNISENIQNTSLYGDNNEYIMEHSSGYSINPIPTELKLEKNGNEYFLSLYNLKDDENQPINNEYILTFKTNNTDFSSLKLEQIQIISFKRTK